MQKLNGIPVAKDKPLFTPGPLTTSLSVKLAMLHDLGAHDGEFIAVVRDVRERLLKVAGVSKEAGYEVVLLQGSGSYGVEAILTCSVPPNGKLLATVNGAYGRRLVKMAQMNKIDTVVLDYPEDEAVKPEDIDRILTEDPSITNVAVVHCETTSGIMSPIDQIGLVCKKHGKSYFVDSMSAFGAMKVDFPGWGIDWLVSSANKCIEGLPGFCFVICRREALLGTKGWSRTHSFDLLDQWNGFESNGQFRFTPPIQSVLAFQQALDELDEEGGVPAREARYRANYQCLIQGMRKLGFTEYVRPEAQGHIITSFNYLDHPKFNFEEFFETVKRKGFVMYMGKVVNHNCFRIGNIGRLFPEDMQGLLGAIRDTLEEMGVR
jgi:2-aminoethylphosphonate-pyruvate transaminase